MSGGGTGNITRRGERSWRLKIEIERDPVTGRRRSRFVTVRGTKKEAQAELVRLLGARDSGSLVEPAKTTVAEYMRAWVKTAATLSLSPKTAERYGQLIERQIVPHLGAHSLQKLKASHIADWHATLLAGGGHDGAPLSARTVGHAHRVLSKALSDANKRELLTRNPASLVAPPKVDAAEIPTLTAEQVAQVIDGMRGTPIYPQVVLLLATGMRRGEIAGLQWGDVDLDAVRLRVDRSVEKTKAGLRLKAPKTRHGRRVVALPAGAVATLKTYRASQLETRLALGRLPTDAFVFGTIEGDVRDPDRLTQDWRRFTAARKLPSVTLHALRHSHASALIAAGTDPVTVSRRLGHGNPAITMSVYAHLFTKSDEAAATAIDGMLGNALEQ